MYNKLNDLVDGIYPFHMPGHKRNSEFLKSCPDITEVSGADDLHHPEGLILAAENNAARLFGVRKTLFSTAGSTPLILAAISAAVMMMDEEVVAAISAAVNMMYEGTGKSPIIRSIKPSTKQSRSAWKTAGVLNNTRPF